MSTSTNGISDKHNVRTELGYVYITNGMFKRGYLMARPEGTLIRGEFISDYLGFFGFGFESDEVPSYMPSTSYVRIDVDSVTAALKSLVALNKFLLDTHRTVPAHLGRLIEEFVNRALIAENNKVITYGRPNIGTETESCVLAGVDWNGKAFVYVGVETPVSQHDDNMNTHPIYRLSELVCLNMYITTPVQDWTQLRSMLRTMNQREFLRPSNDRTQQQHIDTMLEKLSLISTYKT